MTGVKEFGKRYGGRGYTAESARTSTVRGQKVTVSEAAWEGRATPIPLEREAMDQSSADSSRGAFNSGPGFNGVGKPFNSGVGAAARDFGDEGAGKEYYGLHLDIPTRDLAAQLPLLVQPDGSLKDPPPL
ncbi:unnamed protein product [Pylaiella littoralis]